MNKRIKIESLQICRTCLCCIECSDQSIAINNYGKTLNYENMLITDMLEKCSPELDLDISDDAVICNPCYDLLISSYKFKSKCLETEEKIYSYIESNHLRLGDKIDLKDLTNGDNLDEHSTLQHVQPLPSRTVDVLKTESITIKDEHDIKSESETPELSESEAERDQNCKKSKSTQKRYLKREYSCDKCEYKGYRRDLLKKHLLFKCKSRIKSMKYKCDVCSYATIRQRHLTRHKLTHGGQRPYICGICNKGFTEKNNLRSHIMYKHAGIELPYKCGEGNCKAAFSRKYDFNAHLVKHVN